MALGFVAIAIIVIAFVFFNTIAKIQSSPQTGLFVGQNQIAGQAAGGQKTSSQQTAECIADPRKCFGQDANQTGQTNRTNFQ